LEEAGEICKSSGRKAHKEELNFLNLLNLSKNKILNLDKQFLKENREEQMQLWKMPLLS
jgi:hypothetical protein